VDKGLLVSRVSWCRAEDPMGRLIFWVLLGVRLTVCGMRYAVCGMRYAVCGMRYAVREVTVRVVAVNCGGGGRWQDVGVDGVIGMQCDSLIRQATARRKVLTAEGRETSHLSSFLPSALVDPSTSTGRPSEWVAMQQTTLIPQTQFHPLFKGHDSLTLLQPCFQTSNCQSNQSIHGKPI
jgi:hypothetical protein